MNKMTELIHLAITNSTTGKTQIMENVKVGSTGYLDQTEPEDMSGTFGFGKDENGRKFLSIKCKTGKTGKALTVETIFNRYANDDDPIVSGGNLNLTMSAMTDKEFEDIKTLITTGVHPNPCNNRYTGKRISLA